MVHHALRMWSANVKALCSRADLGPIGTHGFRRRMARHLARSSGGVSESLRAKGWRPAAFADHSGRDGLHATVRAELFTDASDSD